MEYLINNHAAEMESGAMIVVTPNRIQNTSQRIRHGR